VFVATLTGHLHDEANVGSSETTDGHRLRAQGWACPLCAVENPCAEGGVGDVVECDYCGSAFALSDVCSITDGGGSAGLRG
jgi:hypothetical protein